VLDAFSLSLSGVLERLIVSLDVLSYFALILTTGIIYSFYTHEATVNHLIVGAVALEDHANTFCVEPSKKLITSARNTENNFDNSWRFAEVFIVLSVYIYTLILVLFALAGPSLSCDITAHIHAEQIHLHWITFVTVFIAGHFLSAFVWPSAHDSVATVVRAIGILLQALLLMALYIVQPPCLGYHLQIFSLQSYQLHASFGTCG